MVCERQRHSLTKRLERTGARPARLGRAVVGADRSTAGRWAALNLGRPHRMAQVKE